MGTSSQIITRPCYYAYHSQIGGATYSSKRWVYILNNVPGSRNPVPERSAKGFLSTTYLERERFLVLTPVKRIRNECSKIAAPNEWWEGDALNHPWPDRQTYYYLTDLKASYAGRIRSKLRQRFANSEFHLGAFIGEFPETVSLIKDTATTLYTAYSAVRRRDFQAAARALGMVEKRVPLRGRGARRLMAQRKDGNLSKGEIARLSSKTVSSAWLQYRYGWSPLVQDAHEGAVALAKAIEEREYIRTRLTVTDEVPLLGTWFNQTYYRNDWASHQVRETQTSKGTLVSRSGMIVDFHKPSLGNIQVGATLWELVPFSFVVDWFVDVGSRIRAAELLRFSTIQDRWESYQSNQLVTSRVQPTGKMTSSLYKSVSAHTSVIEAKHTHFSRSRRTDAFELISARSENTLGVMRMWDSLALLRQIFDGRRPAV